MSLYPNALIPNWLFIGVAYVKLKHVREWGGRSHSVSHHGKILFVRVKHIFFEQLAAGKLEMVVNDVIKVYFR